ncbi:hypothetical protein BSKO_06905 [Bryopsis sp. KO-2023]|nr:hypothetical protein BSKO_06905 [Bryopsis sp. KO-2023]
MNESTSFSDLSSTTRNILYAFGTCCIGALLIFAGVIIQWIVTRLMSLFARPPARKKRIRQKKGVSTEEVEPSPSRTRKPKSGGTHKTIKELMRESEAAQHKKLSGADKHQRHPLFLNSFKDHKNKVTGVGWLPDCSALCTACEDEVIRIFNFSGGVDKNVKMKQFNILGVPVGVGFVGEATKIAVLMEGKVHPASLCMCSLEASDSGPKWITTVTNGIFGKDGPMRMECTISEAGQCPVIVCCSETKAAVVFDRNGVALSSFEPNSFTNHDLGVSHDGKFVSVGTFTADAKVWELQYKNGTFKGSPKVMDLKGHTGQIMSVAFTMDSKKAVTVSLDGTMKVWNLDVWYRKQEDPKCLRTIPLNLPKGKCYHRLSFGPENILAAAFESDIYFIDIYYGTVIHSIEKAHDGKISTLCWAPKKVNTKAKGYCSALASAGTDFRVRLWADPRA